MEIRLEAECHTISQEIIGAGHPSEDLEKGDASDGEELGADLARLVSCIWQNFEKPGDIAASFAENMKYASYHRRR